LLGGKLDSVSGSFPAHDKDAAKVGLMQCHISDAVADSLGPIANIHCQKIIARCKEVIYKPSDQNIIIVKYLMRSYNMFRPK